MNKEAFLTQRQYFDMVHGVTLRAIGVLSDEDLEFCPKDGMRTTKAILFHMYTVEKILAEAVRRGELLDEGSKAYTPEDEIGAAAAAKIGTVDEMQQYAQRCHDAASDALADITDAELSRTVRSAFGEFSGAQFLTFLYDEHWHHRGQFYTYLRLLGKEPPMLYDYENA